MKPTGMVYLVGAGPGDEGLLTLRGAELLARADVVVYDALVNPELLRLAPKSAEIIYGGKRARDERVLWHQGASVCARRIGGGGGKSTRGKDMETMRYGPSYAAHPSVS